MHAESLAKAYVLTHGVQFSDDALQCATEFNAKRQNAVYNLPVDDSMWPEAGRRHSVPSGSDRSAQLDRPQELLLSGDDGYTVCVSAVAPVHGREPARVEVRQGNLRLSTPSWHHLGDSLSQVAFVPEPTYYRRQTSSGRLVRRWVSACGYNEMNVWPWHDCAISQPCSFCGINFVQKQATQSADILHAIKIRRESDAYQVWLSRRKAVLTEIAESVGMAIDDDCYREGVHLIIISGNLADSQLDAQARIYAEIATTIMGQFPTRFADGAVAVTAPPSDLELLWIMKNGGVGVGVFNLEAFTPEAFERHCPGKHRIGRAHYLATLVKGVEVFGWGRSWCNFVLGLESVPDLLAGCEELAAMGVTPGANILHRDHGASLNHEPPDLETVIGFYRELAAIYLRYDQRPYYCQRALRTSLANEAYVGRLN